MMIFATVNAHDFLFEPLVTFQGPLLLFEEMLLLMGGINHKAFFGLAVVTLKS